MGIFFIVLVLVGAGCTSAIPEFDQSEKQREEERLERQVLAFPVENYVEGRTERAFGEYIADGRFTGYHVAEDVEVGAQEEVPVYAIADGVIERAEWISGYGGMVLARHTVEGKEYLVIYGHVDASVEPGELITQGQVLGRLGDDRSSATDGERKHLHFAIYDPEENPGQPVNGYEATAAGVEAWINPHDFYTQHGVEVVSPKRKFEASEEFGGENFPISFTIPSGWEVEYVPDLQALNLFTLAGEGVARERSQMFIRYFDASDFLTLQTVDVLSTENLTVGAEAYAARRYVIEKKPTAENFAGQPSWRNDLHTVTDVRKTEGYTRYYVVAANPDLDEAVYEEVLASMRILSE